MWSTSTGPLLQLTRFCSLLIQTLLNSCSIWGPFSNPLICLSAQERRLELSYSKVQTVHWYKEKQIFQIYGLVVIPTDFYMDLPMMKEHLGKRIEKDSASNFIWEFLKVTLRLIIRTNFRLLSDSGPIFSIFEFVGSSPIIIIEWDRKLDAANLTLTGLMRLLIQKCRFRKWTCLPILS